jgi:hypothetical protein
MRFMVGTFICLIHGIVSQEWFLHVLVSLICSGTNIYILLQEIPYCIPLEDMMFDLYLMCGGNNSSSF